MRAFTAADLVDLWEVTRQGAASSRAASHSPVGCALAILEATSDGEDRQELAALPLGERDQRLLALRRGWFGRALPCHTRCPACDQALEMDLDIDSFLRPPGEAPPRPEVEVVLGALRLTARPLSSADLLALAAGAEEEDSYSEEDSSGDEVSSSVRQLARRCVLSAERGGEAITAAELTSAEISSLAEALSAADPRAELLVNLDCAACDGSWSQPFDIGTYLAAEIEIAAHRLLRQVAALAHGFGWREAEVLALSPLRRRAYLELLGA